MAFCNSLTSHHLYYNFILFCFTVCLYLGLYSFPPRSLTATNTQYKQIFLFNMNKYMLTYIHNVKGTSILFYFILPIFRFVFCPSYRSLINSFQSRDRIEDLKGKTSIELLHKRVNFSSVSQPQIFRSPLKRIKQRYFWTKCKFWPFAIHIKHTRQYFNHKQCDKTL